MVTAARPFFSWRELGHNSDLGRAAAELRMTSSPIHNNKNPPFFHFSSIHPEV